MEDGIKFEIEKRQEVTPVKRKVGRPKIKLDYEEIEKYAKIHCTQEEIASLVGVDRATLLRDKKFCDIYKKGIEEGKASLRRLQWKGAIEGNTSMQIWLGKQLLGQRDKVDNDTEIGVNVNIVLGGNREEWQ